jgi:hypothetical protein
LPDTLSVLESNKGWIEDNFRGLDIDGVGKNESLVDRSRVGGSLTFKETASLISATQNYVQDLDGLILRNLDVASLARESFLGALNRKDSRDLKRKFRGIQKEDRPRFLKNWLAQNVGLSEVPDSIIKEICSLE